MAVMWVRCAVGFGVVKEVVLVPTETVPARFAATAIGLATLAAEALGATLAPAVGGAMAGRFGLAVPLWMGLGGAAAVLLAGLFIREPARRHESAG